MSTHMHSQPCKPLAKSVCKKDLPCGGCRYCRRAHERWQDFKEEVDDITPLTSLFVKKEEQPADPSPQQRGVEELNSVVQELLASGPLDLDSRQASGQLPKVSGCHSRLVCKTTM